MATVDGAIQIPIGFDTTGIQNSLNTVKKQTENTFNDLSKSLEGFSIEKYFSFSTNKTQKEIDSIQKKIEELKNKKNEIKLQPQTKDTEKALKIIDSRIKDLSKQSKILIDIKEAKSSKLKDIDKSIKDLTKRKELLISGDKSAREITREIKQIDKELNKLEKKRELKIEIDNQNLEKAKNSINQINRIAKMSSVAIIGIGTALGLATKQAIDFETQFAEVSTLLGDMPTKSVDNLKQGIIDLSKETGILTSQGIPALYQAISAGVDPNNAIEFLKTASQTAIGGVTDLETAVDGLTSIMNAYGKDVYNVNEISDLLFTTMKLGKTTIGELSSSYFNVIPTASSLGVSLKDVSAAMSTITSAGTPTSVATTQLRQALVELGSESSKVGKLFTELSGKKFKDFIASGGDLQSALQLLEAEAKKNNTTINNLFSSVEAGNAVLSLTGAGAKKFADDLIAMSNSAGATTEAFKKIDETPAQKFKRMSATVSALTMELGKNLIPTFESMIGVFEKSLPTIEKFVAGLGKFITFLVNNGKLTVSIVAGLGSGFVALNVALAITQPALFGVSGGLASVVAGMTALNASTGGLILAIGAVVAGLTMLILNFDKVKIAINDTLALLGNLEAKMNKFNRQASESASAYKEQATAMEGSRSEADKLIETYDRLNKKQNKTASDSKELEKTFAELKVKFPQLAKELEKTGGSFQGIKWDKFLTVDEHALAKQVVEATNKAEKALKQAQDNLNANLEKQKTEPFYRQGNYDKAIAKDREVLAKAEQQYNDIKARQDEIIARALRRQKGYVEETEKAVSSTQKLTKVQGVSIDEYNKAVAKASTVKIQEKDPLKELDKEYEAKKQLIENTINDEKEKNKALEDAEKDYLNRRISIAQDVYVRLNQEGKNRTEKEKEYLKTLEQYTIDSKNRLKELNKPDNQIKELEKQRDIEKQLIEAIVDDEETKNEAIANSDRNYYSKRIAIQQQLVKDILSLTDEEIEARQGELDALYNDIKETQSKLDELNKPAEVSFLDGLKANWQDIASNIGDLFSNVTDIVNQNLDNQLSALETNLDAQISLIESKLEEETKLYEKQLKELEDREKEREKIITETEERIAELNAEIGEHATEEEYLKYKEQLDLHEQTLEEQKAQREADEQEKIRLQEEQALREEQAQQKKLELEKKFAIEKAKIEREQAKNNKASGIVNATISMAQGIAAALVSPITAPVIIPLISSIGAAQIALIASQPLPPIPTFSEGGIVGDANNHIYEKYVGKSGNDKDKTLIWASKGERVLTEQQNKIYERIMSSTYNNSNSVVNNNPNVSLAINVNGSGLDESKLIAKIKKEIPKTVVNAITRGY